MQGTLLRHRERDVFLTAHIDDLLLVGSKEDTEEINLWQSVEATFFEDGWILQH